MSRLRLRPPRAGWLGVAMLGVMLLSLGWAVQGAGWIDRLDFLIPVLLAGGALGAVLGMSRLGVLFVLPLAAVTGAVMVLWTIGGEYFPAVGQLERLHGLRDEAIAFGLTVAGSGYPGQTSPYAIGFGLVAFTSAFIAAHTIERHGHAFDAVLLLGALLVANMSATFIDLFGFLVLFVLAALLLLLRHNLGERETSWQERRVNENYEVPGSILRSGVVFTGVTIGLAWLLTSVAVAAPLTNAWRNLDVVWSDLSDRMQTVVSGITSSDARLGGTHFQSTLRVSGSWFANDGLVMTVASDRPYYMRAITYDEYTGRGWRRGDGTRRTVGVQESVFPGETGERPLATEDDLETITIQLAKSIGRNLFTPGYPIRAFVPMQVYETAGHPVLGGLEATSSITPGQGYSITAAIVYATEAQLSEAGTIYPDHIRALYLGTDGVTDRTRELAEQIVAAAGATNPYTKAKALTTYLSRDPSFTYSTDAALPDDPNRDLVDFFLFDEENGRVGYCEYYASAMTVMARSLGLPARVAVGFGPGDRLPDGTFEVRERNAHAWTEIYFPGFGWQIFEATKSIDPRFVRPAGEPTTGGVAPNRAGTMSGPLEFEQFFDDRSPLGRFNPMDIEPLPGGFEPGGTPPPTDSRESGLVVLLALLAAGGALAYWTLFRNRGSDDGPGGRAWRRMTLAAEQAGVNRNPSETMYEYAAWLEEQIPNRRDEIRVIADGTVWQTYSGRRVTSGLLASIERAWRRLRLPLIWLVARRRVRAALTRRGASRY